MNVNQLVREGLVSRAQWVPETGSTNSVLLSSPDEENDQSGIVLFGADRQTAGRGRRGSRWETADGALTFSLIVPQSYVRELMPFRVALAVADAVRDVGVQDAMVKWPNDVLVGGQKIAGILIEDARQRGLVVGIGINVSNTARQYPEPLRKTLTSVVDQLPAAGETSLDKAQEPDLRYATLRSFLTGLRQWLRAAVDRVVQDGRSRDPFLGRPVALFDGPNRDLRVRGISRGLASTGAYLIETSEGSLAQVHSGTLRLDE